MITMVDSVLSRAASPYGVVVALVNIKAAFKAGAGRVSSVVNFVYELVITEFGHALKLVAAQ